jgi:PAS domain S-box-containing protein
MMGLVCVMSSFLLGLRWGFLFSILSTTLLFLVVNETVSSSFFLQNGQMVHFKNIHIFLSLLQPSVVANYLMYFSYHALRQEEKDKLEIKNRLEKVLDCTIQSMVLLGRDKRILYADAKTKEMIKTYLGKEIKEGELGVAYIPDSLKTVFQNNLEKALNGEKVTVERNVDLIGKNLWFSVLYQPLFDADGKIDSILFSLIDISDQKNIQEELQKAEERWKYALSSSEDGVWDWNLQTGKVYYSKMWKKMVGYSEEEIENSFAGWEKLMHPDDKEKAFSEIVKHVKNQTENYVLEHRLMSKNGQYKWMLSRGKIIERDQNDNPIRFIGTLTDIDHIKRVEQELKAAQLKAEQATEAKSLFLSTMSHEIRTPLNAVIGFSNLLLRENPGSQNSEYLENIQTSANHLLSLINNVLDISKIESGKLEFEKKEFDLEKLAEENLSMLSLRAKEKNIQLSVGHIPSLPYYLIGDPLRLTQVLNNLLGNSVKFTDKGYVRLDIETIFEQGNSIELKFSIKDTGAGIPESKIDTIFESFSQASTDTTRKYGGTGLGLTISRHIINLQGGNIGVNSKLHEGSTFYFNLKFGKGKTIKKKVTKPVDEKEPLLEGLNILVAEDNIFNTKVLTRFLEIWGITYDVAEDGQEALEKIRQKEFDIVLMDLHMPRMDGYEATKRIRETGKHPFILALTASASLGNKEEMAKMGFDDYAVKPINPKELYKRLSEIYHSLSKEKS